MINNKNKEDDSIENETIDYNRNTFDDMELKDNLLRGIYSHGFEHPSIIQQKAIVPVYKGLDVIGQAQSGTGKTATFSIGLLQRIEETLKELQGLIISPTHELAIQTYNVIKSLSHYLDINICLVIGGINIKENIEQLLAKPHIIIGTPGRILDLLINRSILNMKTIKTIVIDEADEMLSQGFQEQIKTLIYSLTKECQVCLFSATLPNEVLNLSNNFISKPYEILVKKEELTLEGIRQYYVYVDKESIKYSVLYDLYNTITVTQSIIYCNSKKKVERLKSDIQNDGYQVSCIHSEMNGNDRKNIMSDFISGSSRVLISTDLLSRGIDIQQVSLVINYDLPKYQESYIHRIGRSGRFGRKGVAINFITRYDIQHMHDIEKFYSTQIEELPSDIQMLF